MTRPLPLAILALAALPALAIARGAPPPSPSPERMRADIVRLVGFGTRSTLSTTTDPRRGIGAARNWAAAQLAADGLTVERPARLFTGERAPAGVRVEDVLGIQPGANGNHQVIIVAGHIDSRVTDVANATSDAPGANDDGSGVAVVLAAARALAHRHYGATIVYAITSGEEQGLWGGTLLAETAKARGWHVEAMLNNDIVGNSVGTDGRRVTNAVRVFSEGIPADADARTVARIRAAGAEDDSPSRELARYVGGLAASGGGGAFHADLVRRPDRFQRGGDQLPMQAAGFPAIRLTSGIENYDAQHQDLRTVGGRAYGDTPARMDFPYLARVAALNIRAIAALADAPPPPARVTLEGAVSSDTTVSWTAVPGAARYRVYIRPATGTPTWRDARDATGTRLVLPGVIVDDNFVGVAAVGADGRESPITFGMPPTR